ncbi:MAG: hypothetical protein LQ344_001024 [Seirophora lacunosa]|nr:MAG: hypothetical protein LQ344_001024 [Seirophora lacunosa]
MPSTYKPSPLSFGSPRTSPFRRPESPKPSPSSPASTIRPSTPTSSPRPTTPTPSPTKPHTPLQSPSKLNTVATPTFTDDEEDDEEDSRTVRNFAPSLTQRGSFTLSTSPTRNSTPVANKPGLMNRMALGGDALARLHPAQVREMREGFQILDRDNDGLVNREDVVDMLTNLGQDASPQIISQFFPPGQAQTLTMPVFLNNLSALLGPFSSQQELTNAFAAFDEDDSGQIDAKELRDALLHTSPEPCERVMTEGEIDQVISEFTGRRAFGKGMGGSGVRGEVFRYQEFVESIIGGREGAPKERQDV